MCLLIGTGSQVTMWPMGLLFHLLCDTCIIEDGANIIKSFELYVNIYFGYLYNIFSKTDICTFDVSFYR